MLFRPKQFPKVGGQRTSNAGRPDRANYDHVWEKLSLSHRRRNPFCRFCEQQGFECTPADDVDHIIPIEDGGAKLDRNNLQSLCRKHHNGLKERLQRYARKHGCIEMLPKWCADPDSRPDLTRRAP